MAASVITFLGCGSVFSVIFSTPDELELFRERSTLLETQLVVLWTFLLFVLEGVSGLSANPVLADQYPLGMAGSISGAAEVIQASGYQRFNSAWAVAPILRIFFLDPGCEFVLLLSRELVWNRILEAGHRLRLGALIANRVRSGTYCPND